MRCVVFILSIIALSLYNLLLHSNVILHFSTDYTLPVIVIPKIMLLVCITMVEILTTSVMHFYFVCQHLSIY